VNAYNSPSQPLKILLKTIKQLTLTKKFNFDA